MVVHLALPGAGLANVPAVRALGVRARPHGADAAVARDGALLAQPDTFLQSRHALAGSSAGAALLRAPGARFDASIQNCRLNHGRSPFGNLNERIRSPSCLGSSTAHRCFTDLRQFSEPRAPPLLLGSKVAGYFRPFHHTNAWSKMLRIWSVLWNPWPGRHW